MKRAFTLIELLIVVGILAVLVTVILLTLNPAGITRKSRDLKRVTDLNKIAGALIQFDSTYGRFPITGGGPTWEDHWDLFAQCLETGVGCGFTIPNYRSVMTNVPNDPRNDPGTKSGGSPLWSNDPTTYYTGWEGRNPGNFILRAHLEDPDHAALKDDFDGGWRTPTDGKCNDPWFCIKYNWPW